MTLRTTALGLILCCGPTTSALADDGLDIQYRVTAYQPTPSGSDVTLELTIQNHGEGDLRDVRLTSADPALALNPQTTAIHLGTVAVGNSAVMRWRVLSPVAAEYLLSGTPLAFNADAVRDGQRVAFPVYSVEVGQ